MRKASKPVGNTARRQADATLCVAVRTSLLVAALYSIVDQIYIANASYLGSCSNAANTDVFPLTVVALATFNKGAFIALQSLGRALSSMHISLLREVVFGVGFAILLPRFFELDGVLYSMPVSDVLTFILAALVLTRTWKELKHPDVSIRI